MADSDASFDAFIKEARPMLGALAASVKDMHRPVITAVLADYVVPDKVAEATEAVLDVFLPSNALIFGDE